MLCRDFLGYARYRYEEHTGNNNNWVTYAAFAVNRSK